MLKGKEKTVYDQIFDYSKEVRTLSGIEQLLSWDQETYMPSGAAAHRSEQIALLAGIIHEKVTSKTYTDLLAQLIDLKTGEIRVKNSSEKEQAALREWRRDYVKLNALPCEFVKEFTQTTSQAMQAWATAKKNNAFAQFAPFLEKIVRMNQQKAKYLGYKDHPYDALLDHHEPGLTKAKLDQIFPRLKKGLISILEKIQSRPQVEDDFLFGKFNHGKQLQFSHYVLDLMQYNKQHGRLDLTSHPFSTTFHPTDSRITTRIHQSSLMSNILSTIHEGGHSLYEMQMPHDEFGSPLGEPISMGIHESQSRFWECFIGQSKPFWKGALPELKKLFPTKLEGVGLAKFYKGLNRVEPSLIRVEADEVTYSLHVILRYELEIALISGDLGIRELPEAWDSKMESMLGIRPKKNSEGCLQDIHWSCGAFGYFPTYSLGTMYAAGFFDTFQKKYPDWESSVGRGELGFIREWLGEEIHQHGRYYLPEDLYKKVTGKEITEKPLLTYLEKKYSDIYSF